MKRLFPALLLALSLAAQPELPDNPGQPNAQRTQEQLRQLLDQYPPAVKGALSIDPGLITNAPFLAPYPALQKFLTAHPEIARNPSYFFESPEIFQERHRDASDRALDLWQAILAGFGAFLAFCALIGLLVWLIRTLIDYRRWSRLSKTQTEVHTKILDRLTSNEDLISYIQSPAGRRFLESSPIKLDAAPRAVGAPQSRILWSVQGGTVLVAAGLGLHFVRNNIGFDEAARPLDALGIIILFVGAGFLVSSVFSYVISQRLGLIEPPPPSQSEPPAA